MISPVTKEISGFSVRFRPLKATKAFTLAKRVGLLLLPVLKGLDLSSVQKEVDISKLTDSIIFSLSSLSDSDAVSLIVESLRGCTIVPPEHPAIEIQGAADIDAAFQGELEAMYEIVLESWKFNKLAPFKLAARFGFQTTQTDTSSEAASTEKKSGTKLAM